MSVGDLTGNRELYCDSAKFEQLLAQLGHDLSNVDRLDEAGQLLWKFCDKVWDWDALMFTARRGRGSFHFRPILMVDTVDDKKINYIGHDSNVAAVSPTWRRLLQGESVLINRHIEQTPGALLAFGNTTRKSASLLYVPFISGDQSIAMMSLQSYTPGRFGEHDRECLIRVAEVAAPHITRCRAEERVKEFMRLGNRLNAAKDTRGVAITVATSALDLLGWDAFSIHLREPASPEFHRVVGIQRHPMHSTIFPQTTFNMPPMAGLMKEVFSGHIVKGGLADISDRNDAWYRPFGDEIPLLNSLVAAPIRSLGEVIGILCLQSDSSDAFANEEEDIVATLAEYCSGALERAWAKQNLQRTEENYRLLVDYVNDGIVISQDEHFVFFNKQFAEMLGYDPDELRGLTYREVYTKRGLDILAQRSAFRQAGLAVPDRYETLFRTKDGNSVPVEANVRIIENFHGKPATFAVVRDIRERKEAEKKLFESEQELRALFAAMTDVILILDAEGNCLNQDNSRNHLRFTVWEPLLDSSLHAVFSREKADYLQHLIARSLAGRRTLNVEYDLPDSNGGTVWYNATVSPLSENSVLMVARDVTERRQAEEELFRSNARYAALLDGSEDYIFVLDRDLRFVHVNSAIERRFNAAPESRIGRRVEDLYGDRAMPPFVEQIKSVFKTGKPVTYDDDAILNGKLVCTETVISPVFSRSGEVDAVMGISRDVTSRRQSALALKRSEQRYAGATRATNDGIWDWNLEQDLIYLSPRWWAIVGEEDASREGDYPPSVWFERVHPDDLETLKQKIDDHVNGFTPHLQDEHRVRHVDGEWRWVLCRGLCVAEDDSPKPSRMAGSISDITDRKAAESMLLYGATHDVLTNLPNRAHFLKSLQRVMNDVQNDKAQGICAVLFLDLDRFKVVNDSLGHLAGDDLIFETARRLERCVRPGDVVARMGGDEFTVMLTGVCKESDVTHVANRIIEELSKPVYIGGFRVQTTVSMGIAFFRPDYTKPDDLLRDADTAMYRAKAAGRNRYQIFDSVMHKNVMAQLRWEGELRQAVAEQQFVLHYQPLYAIQSRKLTGFEALVRWNHPEHGLTSPDKFIELAEETGLILPIGWWVLDQALRDCQKWNEGRAKSDRLTVSVNMSPRQFLHPNLISHIKFLIEDTGAMPSDLIVEITENLLMEDSVDVSEGLKGLRALGIRLDLDDFGTGYSSLSFLRRFPLDMLKIDRSFVQDMDRDVHGQEIVAAILALAKGLHLPVTAEGVETREQLERLEQLGCDCAQGYYFARPMPLEEAFDHIEKANEGQSPGQS